MGPSPGYWWARVGEELKVVKIERDGGDLWVMQFGLSGDGRRLDEFEEDAELVRKIQEPE